MCRDKVFTAVLDMDTLTNKSAVLGQLSAQCGNGLFIANGIRDQVGDFWLRYNCCTFP